jgi:hypothetical protein
MSAKQEIDTVAMLLSMAGAIERLQQQLDAMQVVGANEVRQAQTLAKGEHAYGSPKKGKSGKKPAVPAKDVERPMRWVSIFEHERVEEGEKKKFLLLTARTRPTQALTDAEKAALICAFPAKRFGSKQYKWRVNLDLKKDLDPGDGSLVWTLAFLLPEDVNKAYDAWAENPTPAKMKVWKDLAAGIRDQALERLEHAIDYAQGYASLDRFVEFLDKLPEYSMVPTSAIEARVLGDEDWIKGIRTDGEASTKAKPAPKAEVKVEAKVEKAKTKSAIKYVTW